MKTTTSIEVHCRAPYCRHPAFTSHQGRLYHERNSHPEMDLAEKREKNGKHSVALNNHLSAGRGRKPIVLQAPVAPAPSLSTPIDHKEPVLERVRNYCDQCGEKLPKDPSAKTLKGCPFCLVSFSNEAVHTGRVHAPVAA